VIRRYWPALLVLALAIAAGLAVVAVRSGSDHQLAAKRKVTFQLQWIPSAQFLGFYAARELGYYAEEQLDVDFLHGGDTVNPITQITSGKAHLGLATGDQVVLWSSKNDDPNVDLKALGTVFRRNLARFMSYEEKAIKNPAQLVGKRVGVYPTYDTDNLLRVLLKRHGIAADRLTIISFPNILQFERGELDAFPAYVINEPVLVRQRGKSVHLLDPEEFGVRFYSDTVITKAQYHRDERDTLERFLRASARGWTLAEEDRDAALNAMFRQVGTTIGPGQPWEHQRAVAAETVKHLHSGAHDQVFSMDRSRWEDMEAALHEIGPLKRRVNIDSLCDFDIAPRAIKRR